jgi:hypothetical protein
MLNQSVLSERVHDRAQKRISPVLASHFDSSGRPMFFTLSERFAYSLSPERISYGPASVRG